jgi:hypothetical protein
LYLNGSCAEEDIPIGSRFVNGTGTTKDNGATNHYTGYINHGEYSSISLGNAHRTDDANFIVEVMCQDTEDDDYKKHAEVTVESDLGDGAVDWFCDKDIFAVEPGVVGVDPGGIKGYYDVSIIEGEQLAVSKEGGKGMYHWKGTPCGDECLVDCCNGSWPGGGNLGDPDYPELHDHMVCGYPPYYEWCDPPGCDPVFTTYFWTACSQDVTISAPTLTVYTRLYSAGGAAGNAFKNRVYGVRRGGYYYNSYGGKVLATGILESGEYAMDLAKYSGAHDVVLFDTAQVRFANVQEVDTGLNVAGVTAAEFAILSALSAGLGVTPLAVVFGTVAGVAWIIDVVDEEEDTAGQAQGAIYAMLSKCHPEGTPDAEKLDDASRESSGESSWQTVWTTALGRGWVAGDQWVIWVDVESVSSDEVPGAGSNETSSKVEVKCSSTTDFNCIKKIEVWN